METDKLINNIFLQFRVGTTPFSRLQKLIILKRCLFAKDHLQDF
jgi:hypothetical protein